MTLDEKYQYLQPLWNEWIAEINKIVPTNNEYYNLTHGITENDIKTCAQWEDDEYGSISIPDELINFYRIQDVEYNAVTSVFSFSANGAVYELIPFKDIKKEWEDNVGLNSEDPSEAENLESEFSDMIKTNNYANSKWIPFASNRAGDYLLYDTDPGGKGNYGQIIELQNESWERNVVAKSLTELIQNEIGLLKSGQTEKFGISN